MRIMLSRIFKNKKAEISKSSEINKRPNIYIKRGPEILNQINLIYNLTTFKKNDEYINKLSEILYNCNNINNYPFKRINLDKAIYKINSKNELYITLPNFFRNFRSNTNESKTLNKKIGIKNNNTVKNILHDYCLSPNNVSKNINNNDKNDADTETFKKIITENNNTKLNEKAKNKILEKLKKEYNFETYDNKFNTINVNNNIENIRNNRNNFNKKLFPIIKPNFNKLLSLENISNKKSLKEKISSEVKLIAQKATELNSLKNHSNVKIARTPFYIKPKIKKTIMRKNNSMKRNMINKYHNTEKNIFTSDNGTVLKKMASELITIGKYV